MEQVTYVRQGGSVKVDAHNVKLVFDGTPYTHDRAWSMTSEAFAKLRDQNPDVEFVENVADSR
jgi:hypothetical protein